MPSSRVCVSPDKSHNRHVGARYLSGWHANQEYRTTCGRSGCEDYQVENNKTFVYRLDVSNDGRKCWNECAWRTEPRPATKTHVAGRPTQDGKLPYFFLRRNPNPSSPLPSSSKLAGSGTVPEDVTGVPDGSKTLRGPTLGSSICR